MRHEGDAKAFLLVVSPPLGGRREEAHRASRSIRSDRPAWRATLYRAASSFGPPRAPQRALGARALEPRRLAHGVAGFIARFETGALTGIGRAAAVAFARKGA